ncbi:NB-ARC domain-containing protein [Streptomyces anulatus]|uniref:NB-ARC domain-containing protein n=1 Tax=Streptomyces anulatus TaxID=1892 RepID=UPI00386C9F64|nr:NB-ARC domain-containing protein [Streptomyces anulatus]
MALDGGRIAARGFQYQYLRTVEALLASMRDVEVTACRIEGPGDTVSLQHVDAVDFDLVDAAGRSLMAVQVKSAGSARVVRAREAIAVLVHLVTGFEAREYRLITSAVPDEGCLRLAELLRRHGDDVAVLQEEIKKLLTRAPAAWGLCEALSTQQWQRLGQAGIEFDGRDEAQLREDLSSALRCQREQAGRGLSHRSGGLVLGYLVAEVMRRAVDPGLACWDVEDFRRCVLVGDGELLAAVGRQDFGLIYGQMPLVPDVERSDLVDRIRDVLGTPDTERVAICVITGLSGLGKSSLAAAHIADQAFRYGAIYWVDAETEESLIASFARVLAHLTGSGEPSEVTDPQLLRERVHAQLQSLPGQWLMVFDDANARTAAAWLPSRGRGRVIVTSLGGNWRSVQGRIELSPMSSGEAMQLLRLRLGLNEQEATEHEAPLLQLVQTLEHWPLAIEVACGYLVSCEIGVSRLAAYTDTLLMRAADDEDSVPTGYPRTLAAAVALSVERLISGARARNLLRETLGTLAALCWLGPRRVPVHLALAGAFIAPEELPPAPGWVVFDEAHTPVREVIRELLNVSLVRYDEPLPARAEAFPGSEDTLSMNAVLQVILAQRLRLSETASDGLPLVAGHTDRWLRGAMHTGQAERAWELAQHAAALVRHSEAAEVADLYTSLLMGNLASFHHAHGQYDAAQRLLELELNWLRRAGDPDKSLAAQAHTLLARIAQLRQRTDTAEKLTAHLRPVLAYLQQLPDPLGPAVADLATEALLMLQTQIRIAPDDGLAKVLKDFRAVARRLPPTEASQAVKDLTNIQDLLSSGAADRAEQAITVALAQSPDPWAATTADLKRLLVEAFVMQDKWEEANVALADFLPYAGSRTLYGFAVHHLVHNVGCQCAWKWVVTGEQQAVELLGRLWEETGIHENPALQTATDHARFLLLQVVHGGWRAVKGDSQDRGFLELMGQLSDKTFTDPHDPGSVWERIYGGLMSRMSAVLGDTIERNYQEEMEVIMTPDGGLLLEEPILAANYAAATCHAVLALSTDPLYEALGGTSNIDVLLPEARQWLPPTRPLVILQPITMLGVTSPETGKSVELQIQRACTKGMRRLIGPMPTVPSVDQLTLTLNSQGVILRHADGAILARAFVQASGPWRNAARAGRAAMVYFGYGFEIHDRAEHQRIMASPAEAAQLLDAVREQGLLAGALVSVEVKPLPRKPDAQQRGPAAARTQPQRTTRSGRKKGRR